MENIYIILFSAVMLGLILLSFYFQKQKRRKRAETMVEIASDLGAEYRATHPELATLIKELMSGEREGKIYDSLRFRVGDSELFLVEYEHMVQSQRSLDRAYESAIIIPISPHSTKEVPLFALQKKTMLDSLGRWFGWHPVELSGNTSFNEQMGLTTKPDHVAAVRAFFDQHEQLAEFCRHHPDYHLVSNGRMLAFYRPNHHIKAQPDLFRDQLDLAKQLYGTIWPHRG